MSAAPTPEQDVLVSAVRDFARAELLERDRAWDRSEESCCEVLDRLYELGLMGLRVPEAHGGAAVSMLTYAHILRELAYASPSVAVTVGVHNMAAEIVRTWAPEPLRAPLLEKLAAPGNLAAFALTEPNAGSDPGAARTRAERVVGGWRLTGSKMWVTNGLSCRWLLVLARSDDRDAGGSRSAPDGHAATTEPASAARGTPARDASGPRSVLSMFLMDADQPQLRRTAIKGKMGIRGSETAEMSLDGAFVPEGNLFGEIGGGLRVAFSGLDGGRIGIASQAAGIAAACLDLMTAYSRQREQFGRRIADFQAIQWMLADSAAELTAAEALIDRAARLKDAGRTVTREASMAKLYASEAAGRIADRAVQVHGGYGYVNEFRVEQLYRDARITRLYEGTSEIQRRVIARELLRERA